MNEGCRFIGGEFEAARRRTWIVVPEASGKLGNRQFWCLDELARIAELKINVGRDDLHVQTR
ncbi:MAG: hypothetical protein IH987_09895 [Planctomycetes bacterium]|nr:hypothetical protein [Planctomycetota bacterium]